MSDLHSAGQRRQFFAWLALLLLLTFLAAPGTPDANGEETLPVESGKSLYEKTLPVPAVREQEQMPDAGDQDSAKLFIRQFMVKGATLIDPEIIRKIVSPYENKALTFPEIHALGEKITAQYHARGYMLAYAYIPAQEIEDGVVVCQVVEGRVGHITVSGNKRVSTEFIERHLEFALKNHFLKEDRLERAGLILNSTHYLHVKSTLKSGEDPDTTDITVQAMEAYPLSGNITFDNFGSDITSKNRLGIELATGSLVTSGDFLIFRGLSGLDRIDLDELSYGRAEYQLPLGYNGTRAGVYYANSIYEAGQQYAIMDINGKANAAGIYFTHPLLYQRRRKLDVRWGFDYKDLNDYVLGSEWINDRIRVFNLGVAYDFIDPFHGRNILALTCVQGLRSIFGGNGKNDPGSSRLNADGQFSKYVADVTRAQKITVNSHVLLKGSVQVSGDALFAGEQMYIGGIYGVRGHSSYDLGGDSGYVLSTELYLPPLFPQARVFNQASGNTIRFILFVDHGGVYRNALQPGEHRADYLTSAGGGVRLNAGNRFSMQLDWAVPRKSGNFDTSEAEAYVQAAIHF